MKINITYLKKSAALMMEGFSFITIKQTVKKFFLQDNRLNFKISLVEFS